MMTRSIKHEFKDLGTMLLELIKPISIEGITVSEGYWMQANFEVSDTGVTYRATFDDSMIRQFCTILSSDPDLLEDFLVAKPNIKMLPHAILAEFSQRLGSKAYTFTIQIPKLDGSLAEVNGIIYFIQPCELVGTNRYKIGCSNDTNLGRFRSGYKKGTRFLCIMECNNPFVLEKAIKQHFCKKFKLIGGREYFEGDINLMRMDFIEIVMNSINQYERQINNCIENQQINVDEQSGDEKNFYENAMTHHESQIDDGQEKSNLNNTELFLKDLVENGFNVETDTMDKTKITCTNFNNAFSAWCTQHDTKFISKTFKTQLGNLGIKEKVVKYNSKSARCYILSPDILKEILRDPKFEFHVQADE